jgi:hypothetical protein
MWILQDNYKLANAAFLAGGLDEPLLPADVIKIVDDIGKLMALCLLSRLLPCTNSIPPTAVQSALLAGYLASIAQSGIGSTHTYAVGGSEKQRLAEAFGSFTGRMLTSTHPFL